MQAISKSKIFITCMNSLCTQLKINSQLRMLLFVVIGVSQNAETFEIEASDLQRLLSVNIRNNSMRVDYITEDQLLKLLDEFSRFQTKAGTQLISSTYNPYTKVFSFTLPIFAIADEIISNAMVDPFYDENPVRVIAFFVEEFISSLGGLPNIPRVRKITVKRLLSRLNNVGKTLSKLVELAINEGLSVDEIKSSLAGFGSSVLSIITDKCAELDKLQTRENLFEAANVPVKITVSENSTNFTSNDLSNKLLANQIIHENNYTNNEPIVEEIITNTVSIKIIDTNENINEYATSETITHQINELVKNKGNSTYTSGVVISDDSESIFTAGCFEETTVSGCELIGNSFLSPSSKLDSGIAFAI